MNALKREKASMKQVKFVETAGHKHWVGDGFYVFGMLSPREDLNKYISPFILMDYAAPERFPPTSQRRGVGEHPHRGFETVTFAYQGEVEHRDSSGGGGIIKPGDIQWMTAGSGIVHEEFHSTGFSQTGGMFEMIQLWVNLPKKNKMALPKYQAITNSDIPSVSLAEGVELRVIAGEFEDIHGPSQTFTPINVWDIDGRQSQHISLKFNPGSNTLLFVRSGSLELNQKTIEEQTLLVFEREGDTVSFQSSENFKALVLNGDPIEEPIFAHGPFVMNTKQEIIDAINDYQKGKMGRLS